MSKPSITVTLATNLQYFMAKAQLVQTELAAKSGIGQTTISLYLNPNNRQESASGKVSSPTLARVQALADALSIELWELLRPLTPTQRDLIRSIEAVIAEQIHVGSSEAEDSREIRPRPTRAPSKTKRPPRAA